MDSEEHAKRNYSLLRPTGPHLERLYLALMSKVVRPNICPAFARAIRLPGRLEFTTSSYIEGTCVRRASEETYPACKYALLLRMLERGELPTQYH